MGTNHTIAEEIKKTGPAGSKIADDLMESYEKQFSIGTNFHNNPLFAMMGGAISNTDVSEMHRKYQNLNKLQMEACGNMLNIHAQAFNKQLGFSMDVAVKATEQMQDQFATLVKQHQKFWMELFTETHTPSSENSTKDRETNGQAKK